MKYLKVKTLEKGWQDPDNMILHAAFQCLVNYMDDLNRQKPLRPDWNMCAETKHAWKEIRYLHRWWTKIRPKRKDPIHRKGLKVPPLETKEVPGRTDIVEVLPTDPKKYRGWKNVVKKSAELEKIWFEEDQKNLHRLINVRHHLWV